MKHSLRLSLYTGGEYRVQQQAVALRKKTDNETLTLVGPGMAVERLGPTDNETFTTIGSFFKW